MSRKISSVTQALVILGFDVIKGLILTTSVFDMIKLSIVGLWEHSLGSAAAAKVIATKVGQPDVEEVSMAALLHDLGKVVLTVQLPPETRDQITGLVEKKKISFYEAENEVLGFNHTQVGLWLSEHWKLPQNLAEPMYYHHEPEKAKDAQRQTAIVHLANIVIRARGFGFGGDPFVPRLSPAAWDIDYCQESIRRIRMLKCEACGHELEGKPCQSCEAVNPADAVYCAPANPVTIFNSYILIP